MKNKSRPSRRLVLLDGPGWGQIRVDVDAFFEFSFWMAEELEDLVARWAPRRRTTRPTIVPRSRPSARL